MQKLIFLLFFLCAFTVQAQETKAKIVYKNGEEVSGYYKRTPRFYKFKKNESDKFENIEQEEIETIDYIILTTKKKSVKRGFTNYGLLEIKYYGTYIMVYSGIFYTGNDVDGMSYPRLEFYFKKKDEEYLWKVPGGGFSGFKRKAKKYFQDCPALVAKIDDKVFKKNDAIRVGKFYDRTCKGVKPKRKVREKRN